MITALNLVLALLAVAGLAAVCLYGHVAAAHQQSEEALIEELNPATQLERAA
jgi:hypothetical protein